MENKNSTLTVKQKKTFIINKIILLVILLIAWFGSYFFINLNPDIAVVKNDKNNATINVADYVDSIIKQGWYKKEDYKVEWNVYYIKVSKDWKSEKIVIVKDSKEGRMFSLWDYVNKYTVNKKFSDITKMNEYFWEVKKLNNLDSKYTNKSFLESIKLFNDKEIEFILSI